MKFVLLLLVITATALEAGVTRNEAAGAFLREKQFALEAQADTVFNLRDQVLKTLQKKLEGRNLDGLVPLVKEMFLTVGTFRSKTIKDSLEMARKDCENKDGKELSNLNDALHDTLKKTAESKIDSLSKNIETFLENAATKLTVPTS